MMLSFDLQAFLGRSARSGCAVVSTALGYVRANVRACAVASVAMGTGAACSPPGDPAPARGSSAASAPASVTSVAAPSPAPCASAPPAPPAHRRVRIAAGAYEIGTAEGATLPLSGLKKQRVSVEAFEMDATEVTVRRFAACVAAEACTLAVPTDADALCNWGKPGREDHPMNCASFTQAEAFCAWERSRLPTEIEWEVAAATDLAHETAMPYAEEGVTAVCLTSELSHPGALAKRSAGTCPVVDKPKADSKAGLVDMLGNVSEWTTSRFCETGPGCDERVIRGTSWLGDSYESFRHRWRGPGEGGLDAGRRVPSQVGLRCVRDAPASP